METNETKSPQPANLLAHQSQELAAIRAHCIETGTALGLPPGFFKAAEKSTAADLVGQMLMGLRHSNDQLLEAIEGLKREGAKGLRREAALRAELMTLLQKEPTKG